MQESDLNQGLAEFYADLCQSDRDRYTIAMLVDPQKRAAVMALYAFNLEIARVSEVVSDPMIGEIRLQWWREAIEGIYGGTPRRHPLVEALSQTIAVHDLPQVLFDKLIDSRAADLDDAPFETLNDLEAYAEASSAPLMELVAQVLAGTSFDVKAHGVVWALSGVLRSIAYQASRGRVLLPKAMLRDQDIDAHDLLHGRSSEELSSVVKIIYDRAMHHLASLDRSPSRVILPAVLPVALARGDLARLRRVKFDPFHPGLQQVMMGPNPRRVLRLAWAMMTGKI